jgi:hypothetical protein
VSGTVARPAGGLIAVGMAALLLAGPGWSAWSRTSRPAVRDPREAIERGRMQLRQGNPELAFQAVSDARDNDPGAGEGPLSWRGRSRLA